MEESSLNLKPYFEDVGHLQTMRWTGEVVQVVGLLIESKGPAVALGDFIEIYTSDRRPIRCQVVGFRNGRVLSMPLEEAVGLQLGDRVIAREEAAFIGVGRDLLGRVLDGFGHPIDSGVRLNPEANYSIFATPPNPLDREHITDPLITGIRCIDSLLPCGIGQRVGLFGGSGVGKSTLLSAMARNHSADVSVIALIGERNREVRAFLDHDLGREGLERSVVVVATSDHPAPLRVRACFVAMTIAEYFRDQGLKVLFVMDSVTRLAMAQREIGLATGEPPSQKGYTPSVFALLPKIFERAGNFRNGSITGFFTVLVEGDDFNEPICDAVRSMLDGHIILSRQLQASGHYPAIDVLNSISRLSTQIARDDQQCSARKLREAMAIYARSEDLIQLGAHVQGANPTLDASIRAREQILNFLRQQDREYSTVDATLRDLHAVASLLS
jgi:flagellum-specific ATP synthase